MIYTFGGDKGGVGKTTLALNTAVTRCHSGRKVLTVDTDRQRGLAKLIAARSGQNIPQINCITLYGDIKAPQYVAETILRHSEDYDDIVIDCAPGTNHLELRSALMVTDVLVSPCRPSMLDLNSFSDMNTVVYQAKMMNPKLIALAVLNCCSTNAKSRKAADSREVLHAFEQYCTMESQIVNRDAFSEAVILGQSVIEYKYSPEKARIELTNFTKELFNYDKA